MQTYKLGLIGDNIAHSQAPRLFRIAGAMTGLRLTYDRLVPHETGLEFDALFDQCAAEGYRGINVTYPYKQFAAGRVSVADPLIRAINAVNTVIFEADGPKGFNTDYSGFKAAYRNAFGTAPLGPVCMVGAGGVGNAIAFALVALGLKDIRIVEQDLARADALAAALRAVRPELRVATSLSVAEAIGGAHGLVNCTPVGMVGHDGTPIAQDLMAGARWAFDAVYTPVDTQFLKDAAAAGLQVLSGYELFFYQGVDAFRLFCGLELEQPTLRAKLLDPAADPALAVPGAVGTGAPASR
ncbi:MAG: shikimate dehydrogenase [Rhodospirillaceae bacterium]|nr:shikimate dehydrogenase [Rhodospirillaceae bacterium]